MKYINLTFLAVFLILESCSSKKETIDKEKEEEVINGNDPTIDKEKINEVVTGSCRSGFFSITVDGEEFCTKYGEYSPSLNSKYDNEQRDDLLKFWTYFFNLNSQRHRNWENISFVGTIANLTKTGDYKLDNSAYNVNKETNSYQDRISYVHITKTEDIDGHIHKTAYQYRITDSAVRITKFSKEKISGYYHAVALKGAEIITIKGYFNDWELSPD
ncbi:hypothetical protein [Emticicia sp. BO119]|uniref:hypothetical protein n=1 Tax=Emticicia sp. BO119 TaxID=2757768 RepID=UPI0015EFFD22|nr:hypothetical protein [Emticicia sp. BO119]MBA4850654.1 hypothetical protein [Emticicia sp. BO119]